VWIQDAGPDGDPNGCHGSFYGPSCGAKYDVTLPEGCFDPVPTPETMLSREECAKVCGQGIIMSCTVTGVASPSVTISCQTLYCIGRRPEGLCDEAPVESNSLGHYFAEQARLEAASIDAFRILRDELVGLGAPRTLVRAARRAMRDEARHARRVGGLARRFGGKQRPAMVETRAPRSLEQIAIENATEGCVRETFGALLATWQARNAADPDVRSAMLRIARDETRHAALSWQVAAWINSRLAPEERRRVERARHAASLELLQQLQNEAPPWARAAGLPDSHTATRMGECVMQSLWA
jgi:hypothetical protein